MSAQHVVVDDVTALLDAATILIRDLNGAEVPARAHGKDRQSELSDIRRKLLALAHVLDKARVLTLDQYHSTVRGFNDLVPGGQP